MMRVVFMGTPEFSLPALRSLIANTEVCAVYTQPDKPVGRGLQLQPSPVKKLALEHSIPVFTPVKVSVPDEVARLVAYQADFIVVVAYGQILKLPVIEACKYGCINIHSSLLPRWRGAAPIHRAFLAGDEVSGVTTMMIAPKLDAGDMLLQESTPITAEDTVSSLHDRLAELGGKLILPTLHGLRDGTLKREVQDELKVTYAKKLTKEESHLDWSQSAVQVDLQVRGLNPWPGVIVETTSGLKLKLKQGSVLSKEGSSAVGKIQVQTGKLVMNCGAGTYEILELQEEGKKSVKSSDFMNGLKNRNLEMPMQLKKIETVNE
jgi:methionyl-tRNA formyltransferase